MEYYNLLAIALVLRIFTTVILKIATALDDYRQTNYKKRELDHKIFADWVDRATDENKSPSVRIQILNFIETVYPNRRLEKWAKKCHLELAEDSEGIEEKTNMTADTIHKANELLIDYLNKKTGPPKRKHLKTL